MDARDHLQHGFEIESFLTPTHGLLYAGWLLGGATLAIYAIMQKRQGKPRDAWLPKGYAASAIGFVVFGLGGGVDLFWHSIYGFEVNLEAPISPGHTLLVIGSALMYAAVIFHGAHLYRANPQRFSSSLNRRSLPTVLAMISLMSAFLWPTWFLDTLLVDFPSGGVMAQKIYAFGIFDYGGDLATAAGLSGVLLMTLMTLPLILLPLILWRMPVGYLTILMVGYTGLRATVGNTYIYLPATLAAAIIADLIWAWVRRGGEARLTSPTGYRLIAFSIPVVQYLVFFAIIGAVAQLLWSPYLWAGVTFVAGVLGLLISYILVKPTNRGLDAWLYRLNIL